MDQKDKNYSQITHKDIVKDIFDKPKAEKEKVSTIFTHFKPSSKIISPLPHKEIPSPHLKPLPVAIDIGTSSIKLLQLAEGKKGDLEIVAIDEEKLVGGTGSEPTSARSALRHIINRNRPGPLCVTTLFPGDVQLYSMLFPPMAEDELISAIRYKVTQLRPFDSDIDKLIVRYLKWNGTAELTKAVQQKVVVICVSRAAFENRMSLLHETGLKPVRVGISPFDLINLSKYYTAKDIKDEVTLWIDFGAENTFLAIEKDDCLCFSRNLTLSSKHLTKALAQYRGIGEEEAEELKRNYGLIFWAADKKIPAFYEPSESPDKTQDKSELVYYGLISHLENLVVDIMHSFKYFSYQVAHSQITRFHRIILCGGGANLKNLDHFLSVRLGVPVEKINPFSLFKLSDHMQTRRKDLITASTNFAVCTGSAIGQKIQQPKQINLLAEEKKEPFKIFSAALRQVPVMVGMLVIVCGIALFSTQAAKAGYYKKEMASLIKKVTMAKARLGKMQAMQLSLNKEEAGSLNKKALLEARLNLIREGLREPEDFSKRLTIIANLLPEDIWINKLNYKDGRLYISGSTADVALIQAFIEDIKSSEEFVAADFSYTEKDTATQVYNFEIIAVVDNAE